MFLLDYHELKKSRKTTKQDVTAVKRVPQPSHTPISCVGNFLRDIKATVEGGV